MRTEKEEARNTKEEKKRLTSEEYFESQKEIQRELLRNEELLSKFAESQHDISKLQSDLDIAVRRMMRENMNTFPTYEKGESRHAIAIPDPREIVMEIESKETLVPPKDRDTIHVLSRRIASFADTYNLDLPNMWAVKDAGKMWKEIQKAYHARMFELQSGLEPPKGDDLKEI